MPLTRYANECRGLAEEIVESLTTRDTHALRDQVRELGMRGWVAWRATNTARVASYVAATPSARSKQRQYQTDRQLLALAAYAHCHEAADLLTAAARLQPGCSYRRMAADAGIQAERLQWEQDWTDWPWEGPDPFDELT